MDELTERAEIYATQAHERINHRRKYSNQPYQEHLRAVAGLVADVTDDPEMVAAAWLHDTVEDTSATLGQIEQEFGVSVAGLVAELTDVSKPSDGNRAVRKKIDRDHLALASARAQTVKLADLIDKCTDITQHDTRFAKVYLAEMEALLEVLQQADGRLLKRAYKVHAQSVERLKNAGPDKQRVETAFSSEEPFTGVSESQFRRMFTEIFTARDIAEPLLSFDHDKPSHEIHAVLVEHQDDVASIRVNGSVEGYVRQADLADGGCRENLRRFAVNQVVTGSSTLADVIHVLTRNDYCFVALLGEVVGVICRDDINKPMVRMWLFGIITMIEMTLVDLIKRHFPDDSWQDRVSEGRLKMAHRFREERMRRNQHCGLVDCLQFSDKGYILIGYPPTLEELGFESRRSARRVVADIESLRNNLAHAQDIVTHDWVQIARMTQRMQEISEG